MLLIKRFVSTRCQKTNLGKSAKLVEKKRNEAGFNLTQGLRASWCRPLAIDKIIKENQSIMKLLPSSFGAAVLHSEINTSQK